MGGMNELSNKYAQAAIGERRAELAGEIVALESRLRSLRESLVHVDVTLKLFAPGFDPASIKAKRPYERAKMFGAGKLNRIILDALRRAGRPLSVAEVTDAVCAEMGFGPDARAGMRERVRSNLLYLAKIRGTVTKDGEREAARWGLV